MRAYIPPDEATMFLWRERIEVLTAALRDFDHHGLSKESEQLLRKVNACWREPITVEEAMNAAK